MTMDVSRGVYLSGFARGGTTWARQILSAHPDVFEVTKQVGFKAPATVTFDKAHIEDKITKMLASFPDADAQIGEIKNATKFAVKAPPNSLILSEMMDILPRAKHVFILRDPRDVLVSHQRTGVAWTEAHRDFDMAMHRTAEFYNGYAKAKGREGLLLFKYEDAHQSFPSTFKCLCDFMELETNNTFIHSAMQRLSFRAVTGRSHEERTGMNRRGVAGDWVKNLSWTDGLMFQQSDYWASLMSEHGYDWQLTNLQTIVETAAKAGVQGCGLKAEKPGAHLIWSLSDCQWGNMETVAGILRRCRQGLKLSQANEFPTTIMLNGPIPERNFNALSNSLNKSPIALEVNLNAMPQSAKQFTKHLEEIIRETLPTLNALNDDAPVKAILFGDSWDMYALAHGILKKHGIQTVSLKNPTAETAHPVSWLLCDKANTLTLYGQAEGFSPLLIDDWKQQNSVNYIIGKLTTSSLQDPLSLGFRTCFDDVQSAS